jgi:NitT/TauT family transport system substrate-binding protein
MPCLISLARAQSRPDEVVFALNWLPVGESAGWYVGLEKGFFAANNITVSIARGFGSEDTAKRVATGRAQFGVADTGTTIVLRNREGVRIKDVAMFFGKEPHAIYYKKDSIHTPKDLEGKGIVCPANSAAGVMFPAFAARLGIDLQKIRWLVSDQAVIIPTFAAGRGDALCYYVTGRPAVLAQAPWAGEFLYTDYGLDFYSNAVITHEDTIREKPDLVRRFTMAALRGLQYGLENPKEAVAILKKYAPENQEAIALEEWKVTSGLIMSPEAQRNGVGYMLPEKMKTTYDLVTAAFKLNGSKDTAANLYTNEFLK